MTTNVNMFNYCKVPFPVASKEDSTTLVEKLDQWRRSHILDEVPFRMADLNKPGEIAKLVDAEEWTEALHMCNNLVEQHPKWLESWLCKGDVLFHQFESTKDFHLLREAEAAYNQASKISRRDPFLLRKLGRVAYTNNEFERALKLFSSAQTSMEEMVGDERLHIGKEPSTARWIQLCNAQIASPSSTNSRQGWLKA